MQVSFEITDAKTIAAVVAALSGSTPAKRGPGRPPKAKVELVEDVEDEEDTDEETEDEEDTEEDSSDEEDAEEDSSDDDEETEDEEDEKPKKAAKGPALGDVIKLFSKNREKGAKLLKKFKVKTVRELKAAQYPAFIKALKAA